MANVQISEELFFNLVKWHICDLNDDDIHAAIVKGLEEKAQAMINRQLYTTSKNGSTAEEREKARKEYLDRKGIPESFRW